jgi:hypothetical protein
MPRSPFIAIALVIVVAGTAVGVHGHVWIAVAADVAGILVAVGGRALSKRLGRGKSPGGR